MPEPDPPCCAGALLALVSCGLALDLASASASADELPGDKSDKVLETLSTLLALRPSPPSLPPAPAPCPLPLGVQVGLKLLRVTSEEGAHSERVTALAFAPDGKTLISGSHDKSIAAWDAAPLDAEEGAHSWPTLYLTPSALIRIGALPTRTVEAGGLRLAFQP